MTKTCAICGKAFEVSKNARCCSPECSREMRLRRRRTDWMWKHPETKKTGSVAKCPVCGVDFVRTGPQSVYCSRKCHNEKRRSARRGCVLGASKACELCGKDFVITAPGRMYCSKECERKASYAKQKARRQQLRAMVAPVERTCPVCGKTFTTGKSTKVYCSRYCLNLAHHPHVQKRDLVCVFCGKAFKSRYSTASYCSQLCNSRANSGYATLTDFEKAQAERAAAHVRRTERDRNGLTLAQIQEVIAAQDGDPSQLWKRSQSWTAAQRKYARDRYQEMHGLFTQTWNP